MCSGGLRYGLSEINGKLPKGRGGKPGFNNKKTGEIQYLDESTGDHYKRVEKMRQAQADEMASQQRTLIAQQQAESQRLQAQMVQQQQEQSKQVAGLQADQAKRIGGIKAQGAAASSALRALAQSQPTAPTAQITKRIGQSGAPKATRTSLRIGQTSRGVGSGSNLSI